MKSVRKFPILVLSTFAFSSIALAAEVDSFTPRFEMIQLPQGSYKGRPIQDMRASVNLESNKVIQKVIEKANKKAFKNQLWCDSTEGRQNLIESFKRIKGTEFGWALKKYFSGNPEVAKTLVAKSIYKDFTPLHSISLSVWSRLFRTMGALMRFDLTESISSQVPSDLSLIDERLEGVEPVSIIKDEQTYDYYILPTQQAYVVGPDGVKLVTPVLVGSDKFSHFFAGGMNPYTHFYLKGEQEEYTPEEIGTHNMSSELSIYGMRTTGVASFADAMTNFQGLRFFMQVMDKTISGAPARDLLTGEPIENPYVKCGDDNKWLQIRDFDISDYLDATWDEGINCNAYYTPTHVKQVNRRLEQLSEKNGVDALYDCSNWNFLLEKPIQKFGPFAPYLINLESKSYSIKERRQAAP